MEITLLLPPEVALFYEKVATCCHLPLEKVLTDTLFKLAGELSLEALQATQSF